MALNLKEYILFRTEIKRELFNEEVDRNFQAVANPWVDYRRYEEGDVIYHPVTLESESGKEVTTGELPEYLVWWRANTRTTLGVFNLTQWDMIGGVGGFTDITILGSDTFGKVLANWCHGPAVSWDMNCDGDISASGPTDTLKIAAGAGIDIGWNTAHTALRISATGSVGEVNEGENISTGIPAVETGANIYSGMAGASPNRDLQFFGLTAQNDGWVDLFAHGPLYITGPTVANNIQFNLDTSLISLADLDAGCPTLDMLCDVDYPSGNPTGGDLLQWDGTAWIPVGTSLIGSINLYETNSTVTAAARIATLNGGGGHLRFAGNGTGTYTAPGFGMNNTGEQFSMGANSGTFDTVLHLTANDPAMTTQLTITNEDLGGGAGILFDRPGHATNPWFIIYQNSITISQGTAATGLATDAWSIDDNWDMWVHEWGLGAVVPTQDEHYIPFAAPQGASQGLTATSEGFFWAYDGTDGSESDSQALYINTAQLIGTTKPAIALTNVPDDNTTQVAVGISSQIFPANNLPTAALSSAWATHAMVHDHIDPAPNVALNIFSGHYSELHQGITGYEAKLNNGSSAIDIGVGFSSLSDGDQLEQYGFTALWELGASAPLAKIGIFSDVVNTYGDTLNITEDGTWAGFFRGCVNITEGGLVLAESPTMPDCNIVTGDNIEDRTLWINSTDNHLYLGNVDLQYSECCSVCDLVDVECPTGLEDGSMLVYDLSTDLWTATDPSLIGDNIYTVDGSLTGDRVVDGGYPQHDLTFQNIGAWTTASTTSDNTTLGGSYTIDSGDTVDISANSSLSLYSFNETTITTVNGVIELQSNGYNAQIILDSENDILLDASGTSGWIHILADQHTLIQSDTFNQFSSGSYTGISADTYMVLQSQDQMTITAGTASSRNNIQIGHSNWTDDVSINAYRNILLSANTNTKPNDITLTVGSDPTDSIKIETYGWNSLLVPSGNLNRGPLLMRLKNTAGTDVTEYGQWLMPATIPTGAEGYILQVKEDLSGVDWRDPGAISLMEICGYDIDCPTGGLVDGDMLVFNGTDDIWYVQPAPAGLTTIYTGDSTLLGNREVEMAGNQLVFNDGAQPVLSLDGSGVYPGGSFVGIGNISTDGYTLPLTQGSVGQILALVSPNTVDWVDDSVFTLCDAPVDCPTGGPSDGDALIYSGGTGMWEVTTVSTLDTNIATTNLTFNDGNKDVDLNGNRWVIKDGTGLGANNLFQVSSGSGGLIIIGNGVGTSAPATGYSIPHIRGEEGQVITMAPGSGPGGAPLFGDGDTEWAYPLCAPVDCPTGGPVDGDTLLFNGATGFWDLSQGVGDGGIYEGSGTVPSGVIATYDGDITFEQGTISGTFGINANAGADCSEITFLINDSQGSPTFMVINGGTEAGHISKGRIAIGDGWGGDLTRVGVVEGNPATTNVSLNLYDIVTEYNAADDCVADTVMEDNGITSQKQYDVVDSGGDGNKSAAFLRVSLNDDYTADPGNPYNALRLYAGHDGTADANSSTISSIVSYTYAGIASGDTNKLLGWGSGIGNQGGGTVAEATHIELGAISASATITNRYGIRQMGTLDENEFAGPITMMDEQELRFFDSGDVQYTGFKSPATMTGDIIYELPDADAGSAGYCLTSDGAGVLSWNPAGSGAVIAAAEGLTLDVATVELGDEDGGGGGSLTVDREVLLGENFIRWDLSGPNLWMLGQEGVVGLGEFTDDTSIGSMLHIDGVDVGAVSGFTDTTLLLSGQGATSLLQPVQVFHARYDDTDMIYSDSGTNVVGVDSTDDDSNVLGTIRFDGYVKEDWGASPLPLGEGGTSSLWDGGNLDGLSKIQGFPRYFSTTAVGYPYDPDTPMFEEGMAPATNFTFGEINFQGKIYNYTDQDVPTHLSGTSIKMSSYWSYLDGSANGWSGDEMEDINYASLLIGSQDVGDTSGDATAIHTAMLDVVGANGTDPSGGATRSPGPFVRFRGMPSGGTDVVMIDSEDYLFKTGTKELLSGVGSGTGSVSIGITATIIKDLSIGITLDEQVTPYLSNADTVVIGTGANPGVIGDNIFIAGTDGPGSPDPFDISGSMILGTMGPGKSYQGLQGMLLGPGVNTSLATQAEDFAGYWGGIGLDANPDGLPNIVFQTSHAEVGAAKMRVNAGTADRGAVSGDMPLMDAAVVFEVFGAGGYDVASFKAQDGVTEIFAISNDDGNVRIGDGGTSYTLPGAGGTLGDVLSMGIGSVDFVDVNTLVKENAFETLIASNSMFLNTTLPASGTDEAVIGDHGVTGAGWNGNTWDLTHDFATPDDLSPENMNCGVLLPHNMEIGDIITITCNLYGPNLDSGDQLSIFCYSYDCGAVTPEELTQVGDGEETVEIGGSLTCFTRPFTLTDGLSKGQGIVIGWGNYVAGGLGTADDIRITYSVIATTTI